MIGRRQFLARAAIFAVAGVSSMRTVRGEWSSFALPVGGEPGRRRPVIAALALQRTGEFLAAAGDDHAVGVWHLGTGRAEQPLRGHDDWVRAVCFSPDDRWLASAGNDGAVLLWDATNAWQPRQLAPRGPATCGLAFSPDGRYLAAVGFEKSLRMYDVSGAGQDRVLTCPCRDMRAVAFAGDRPLLAAAGRNGIVRVWDIQQDRVMAERRLHTQRVRDLMFSADSQLLATVGDDGTLRTWQWESDQLSEFPRLPSKLLAVTFLGGGRIATGGSDNRIHIWDVTSRRQVHCLEGHQGSVTSLVSRGDVLISASFDTTIRVWSEQPAQDTLRVSTPLQASRPETVEAAVQRQ